LLTYKNRFLFRI